MSAYFLGASFDLTEDLERIKKKAKEDRAMNDDDKVTQFEDKDLRAFLLSVVPSANIGVIQVGYDNFYCYPYYVKVHADVMFNDAVTHLLCIPSGAYRVMEASAVRSNRQGYYFETILSLAKLPDTGEIRQTEIKTKSQIEYATMISDQLNTIERNLRNVREMVKVSFDPSDIKQAQDELVQLKEELKQTQKEISCGCSVPCNPAPVSKVNLSEKYNLDLDIKSNVEVWFGNTFIGLTDKNSDIALPENEGILARYISQPIPEAMKAMIEAATTNSSDGVIESYITKPFDVDDVIAVCKAQPEFMKELRAKLRELKGLPK